MGCTRLLLLGLVLNVAHCREMLDNDTNLDISHNIIAILGEAIYLNCSYVGESQIERVELKRYITSKKAKRLAGFSNGKIFNNGNFSIQASSAYLRVLMNVTSVEVEGKYSCEFESGVDNFFSTLFITVIARPDVNVIVTGETVNGTHYQSVSCSATGGRPVPQISWLVSGLPPSDPPFTVNMTKTHHSDGTSTLRSILRFPTHLQDEDSVTCVVHHPALSNPEFTTARVETYTKPNVTIKAKMVQQEGNDFWVVFCISSGGSPATDISLALNTSEEPQRQTDTDRDMQRVSVQLPTTEYQGHNITCIFHHPKFTHKETRNIMLPTFYLSSAQSYSEPADNSEDFPIPELLALQEGDAGAVIGLKVTENVPRYNVICKKDDGVLPDGVELLGRNLTIQGPVEHHHAGLYECVFSYHHLKAKLKFNVTVKPPVVHYVPPTVQTELRTEYGRRVIECSAADAVPAANVSWLLPEGVSVDFWFNSTSHNGSHSVSEVLLLPACLPLEITAECVIKHPAFEKPESRSITLPLCAHPNITISSSTEWRGGRKYTKVHCSVDSAAPAADVTWYVGNSNNSIASLMESEAHDDGLVSARSSVHFLSSIYAGQNLMCMVKHSSLEAPETRTIAIPEHKPPLLSLSVVRQRHSPLWLAVCDCIGECVESKLAFLPESTKNPLSVNSEYGGNTLKVRLAYEFPLSSHEGQNLTCVYQFDHMVTEKRTVHIPRYYISSVRILNHTSPLRSHYSDGAVLYRLSLHKDSHVQKILLQIEGNVPEYNLSCQRSDGSFVQMDGAAIIFPSALTEQDKGLYICQASFYHHTATVSIQVEDTSEEQMFVLVAIMCLSSASAITLVLVIILCVCCKRNKRTYKQRESLAGLTALMQEPGSPQMKKPEGTEKDSEEYAHLVGYAIVIDVKSTV
ncbi:uncharacterized protein KZ484_022617 isoform 2-T2 [Pholidichthys leucotaenia]